MYDLMMLRKEVNETLIKANCTVTCPVTLNGRLTRCLGRAIFTIDRRNNTITVKGIEFSREMVARATDHTIREVLLHECAHVIANLRMGYNCGHNATFKAVCHEIGTTNDKTTTKVEYRTDLPRATHRFEILCPNCGVVATRDRVCQLTKNASHYRCKCGSNHLTVWANW